jgi:hypothetical protein
MVKRRTMDKLWKAIKAKGSAHYKGAEVEPLDLIKAGGMLQDKAVSDIIKYAYRNRRSTGKPVNPEDIEKIKHYASMLELFT